MVTTEEQSKRNKRLARVLAGIFVVLLVGSTVLLMVSAQGREIRRRRFQIAGLEDVHGWGCPGTK
jgi:hypothetical protein